MDDKRRTAAVAAVVAAFIIAAAAIFISQLVPDGTYEVTAERHYAAVSESPSQNSGASAQESGTPAPESGRININTASKEELCELVGIGESLAQAIIDDREAEGPFETAAEIMRVKGIGEGIYSRIRDSITVGGE